MAEHRQLLMERQLMMDDMDADNEEDESSLEEKADELFNEFEEKKNASDNNEDESHPENGQNKLDEIDEEE
jgi:uncharacterized protein (UPF0305 family)